jgi:hypothetical protein
MPRMVAEMARSADWRMALAWRRDGYPARRTARAGRRYERRDYGPALSRAPDQAAEKKARALKAEFPMLQIKVYDAAEKTRTLVVLPPGKAVPIEEGS